MNLFIGQRFHTPYESGCVVRTLPDDLGNFTAYDADGNESGYHLSMICSCTKLH